MIKIFVLYGTHQTRNGSIILANAGYIFNNVSLKDSFLLITPLLEKYIVLYKMLANSTRAIKKKLLISIYYVIRKFLKIDLKRVNINDLKISLHCIFNLKYNSTNILCNNEKVGLKINKIYNEIKQV